jgi:hypothetical protein
LKAEALRWLLGTDNPPVRMFTLVDFLKRRESEEDVRLAKDAILSYEPVKKLLRAQKGKGYWPPDNSCYSPKFTATVWALNLVGEMGVGREPWVESAAERFLRQHQMENGAFCCNIIGGRGKAIEEVCLTGHMARTFLALGYDDDPRVMKAVDWLPEQQLDDGGWNCDYPMYEPTHSSFMSTIHALWAYSEVPRSRWSRKTKRAAEAGAEFLLSHRLFKSHRDWRPVELRGLDRVFTGTLVTQFHFPMYYYFDALHGLRVLTELGYEDDERISDAVHLLLSKRTPDGRWLLDGDWVRERSDKTRKNLVNVEELTKPSKWITLNCYRVLAKTGELEIPQSIS